MRRIFVLAVVLFLGLIGIIARAQLAETSDLAHNLRAATAEGSALGSRPAFIRITYKIQSENNSAPGAIAVYVHTNRKLQVNERILVNRIFPFAPAAGKDSLRQAVVQVPNEVAKRIGAEPSSIIVELEFDPELSAHKFKDGALTLDKATIVYGQ